MNLDKIQKRFIRFLQIGASVYTGGTIHSLWFAHDNHWKISMPLVLLCLSLERYISRD